MTRKLTTEQRKRVHSRLEHWAMAYGDNRVGESFGVSPMFAMMAAGGSGDGAGIPIDELAAEVEAAVNNLPAREREVIREYYLVTDSTLDQKCRATRTNKDSFYRARHNGMLLVFMELEINRMASRRAG